MRRKFITEEANSSKEILDICPYLGKSYHVRPEMRCILGDACVAGAEDCFVRGLRVILNQDGHNLTNADVVDAVKIIQQRTKNNSSNQEVFKFQDPTTPPHKLFKDKGVEFFLVCIGSCQEVDQVLVCGEGQAFFESDCNLTKAAVDLICAYMYYVFGIKYPKCISGVLHFLQEIVLLQSENEFKGTKFATFMAEFKKGSLK